MNNKETANIIWRAGDIARPIISGELFEPCFIMKTDHDKQLDTKMYQLKVYNTNNNGSYELRWFSEKALQFIPRNYNQLERHKN